MLFDFCYPYLLQELKEEEVFYLKPEEWDLHLHVIEGT